MPEHDLIILGGGAIGLSAAYLAARAGRKVLVLEGAPQVGGLLGTFPIGNTRLEHYYHHFFSHDAELRWLCGELGIANKLRFHPASMGMFRDGAIHPFNGPADLLRFSPIPFVDRLRFAASSAWLAKFVDWRKAEGESAIKWLYRHAGRTATEAIWRPMLEIKFGPHAKEVPVAWMAGRLRQRINSRERGGERLGYLDGSLQTLLDTLLTELGKLGVDIRVGTPASELVVREGKVQAVKTQDGEEYSGRTFLCTLPSRQSARLLEHSAPDYAAKLDAVRYFGAACTILELDRPLSSTYWLNVADPGFPFGGVIEHTNLIPPSVYGNRNLVYLSRYYESGNELATLSKDDIIARMTAPLTRIYADHKPDHIRAAHVFRTETAATVCDLNYSRTVPPVRTPHTNLFFASMVHVYPDERSCNNAIRIAANACQTMQLDVPEVPKLASLSADIGFAP